MVRGGKRAAAVALLLLAGAACAQGPSWWTNRGVLDTSAATTNDFLFARLGQLKWFTTNAYDELEENLPGGAGTNLAAVVGGLNNTDNFYLVNLGQLKNLSQPVYARLIAAGYTNAYPWTATTNDDFDYGLANLGQLKNVFSFDISTDTDEDGLADWWEIHWFGGITNWDGAADPDEDGISNSNEYWNGTCPAFRCVSPSGSHTWPYATWATAATNIQTAINAAGAGEAVWVSNGMTYGWGPGAGDCVTVAGVPGTNRIAVTNQVKVRSVNGPEVTAIVGLESDHIRCAYVAAGSLLAGFSLTNGDAGAHNGGGALCADATGGLPAGTVSNCLVRENNAMNGGGVSGGRAVDCQIANNMTAGNGGGTYGGTVEDCEVSLNGAQCNGGGTYGGIVEDCEIRLNTAQGDGGGCWSGTVERCTISSNEATGNGGGACEAELNDCEIQGNSAEAGYGGGTYGGAADRCEITDNQAANGGGCYAGQIANSVIRLNSGTGMGGGTCQSTNRNCTITDNTGAEGGGMAGGTGLNCVVWYNGVNYTTGGVPPVTFFSYSCTTPFPGGPWNITNEPCFADRPGGDLRLTSTSPCVDAAPWLAVFEEDGKGYDLDGRPRPLDGDGDGEEWVDMGAYERDASADSATGSPCFFVSPGGSHTAPYDTWSKAATNIQVAIDAAEAGALILVGPGAYAAGSRIVSGSQGNRVALDKAVTVLGVCGPDYTILAGTTDVRCAYVTNGACLRGFTLSGGRTCSEGDVAAEQSGGGAWCEPDGLVAWCTLAGNHATSNGGAGYGGSFHGCLIQGNEAEAGGGLHGAVARSCVLTNNSAAVGGGSYGCTNENCTIVANSASSAGGGTVTGVVRNCIVYYNTVSGSPDNVSGAGEAIYTCAAPDPGGNGNFTNAPGLRAGDWHVETNSPCLGAGSNLSWAAAGWDLDGEPRLDGEDCEVGADEMRDANANAVPDWWEAEHGEDRLSSTAPFEFWVEAMSNQTVTFAFTNLDLFYDAGSVSNLYRWNDGAETALPGPSLTLEPVAAWTTNVLTAIRQVSGTAVASNSLTWVQRDDQPSYGVFPQIPLRPVRGTNEFVFASWSNTVANVPGWDRFYLSGSPSTSSWWSLPTGTVIRLSVLGAPPVDPVALGQGEAPWCLDLTEHMPTNRWPTGVQIRFEAVCDGTGPSYGIPDGPLYLLRWGPGVQFSQ